MVRCDLWVIQRSSVSAARGRADLDSRDWGHARRWHRAGKGAVADSLTLFGVRTAKRQEHVCGTSLDQYKGGGGDHGCRHAPNRSYSSRCVWSFGYKRPGFDRLREQTTDARDEVWSHVFWRLWRVWSSGSEGSSIVYISWTLDLIELFLLQYTCDDSIVLP